MNLGLNTLEVFAKMLAGDDQSMPYRSGPKLIQFFNQHGFNDHYPNSGFPTRWVFAFEKLKQMNGKDQLRNVINAAFDPRHFINHPSLPHAAAEHLNKYLKFDKFELAGDGDHYKVRAIGGVAVKFAAAAPHPTVDEGYIFEQVAKCEKKIAECDYDGAITNAHTLLEKVLLDLEKLQTGKETDYDGKVRELYKRVQKGLNLAPSRTDINEILKQVLTGLSSIVNGLAGMRNNMSDAHAGYKPSKRHAKLAVNAAKTLADFLFETYAYQQAKQKG
ncbi:MAG: abortive infection family protein [Flavobacteriales bacterium]|nr:abortive infection family protein [Flavobacteriales bacterium]